MIMNGSPQSPTIIGIDDIMHMKVGALVNSRTSTAEWSGREDPTVDGPKGSSYKFRKNDQDGNERLNSTFADFSHSFETHWTYFMKAYFLFQDETLRSNLSDSVAIFLLVRLQEMDSTKDIPS